MNDARSLFEAKIKLALEQYNALKLNAELAAEYIIKKKDEETTSIKYFNTKDVSLIQTTNLNEWFEQNWLAIEGYLKP